MRVSDFFSVRSFYHLFLYDYVTKLNDPLGSKCMCSDLPMEGSILGFSTVEEEWPKT